MVLLFTLKTLGVIVLLILAVPFAWILAWFIPFPGTVSGYEWSRHFKIMEQLRNLDKRARGLNVGTIQPEPGNEVDEYFANCSKYEMVRELWQISKTYPDAYPKTENYWHEMREIRAMGFRTVDKGDDTFVGYRGDDPTETVRTYKPKQTGGKMSRIDQEINVVELDPIPSEAGTKPPPTEEEPS
jgi:hypothetical protein